ncbi:cellulose synthase complex periplasmic endoglucanase BcsZ [Ramlibacter sp. H39-3-26]|uniref:cellulose synthase complex periplasmic endoglucanase BcsZ n=1 Tax=Curvibacter soli TaxID=3031331 RepID=UPI0023DCAFD6|nr:cellulose synthase complex periplasmic endoglucanase BcsZ [Ramlibacter sp. H39-3-26]MDF1486006.1 cellulose synthase complex periplasmic endoglucanase BcsZ [Ramlibacter sp. H39-3-26]
MAAEAHARHAATFAHTVPNTPDGRRGGRAICGGAMALLFAAAAQATPACRVAEWPLWQTFVGRYVQADGRVIDYGVTRQHSTSEGQSYAMFFALVAHDRDRFDRLWRWSVANLAGGDIQARLPAWQWGRRDDGSWGVIDSNTASDADLWFAYALLEGGRVWNEPRYTADARALLARITQDEVAELPGLGPMLLPAPAGFVLQNRIWRINPSYLPLPLLRRLAQFDAKGPWKAVTASFARMMAETTPKGFAPDWVAYQVPEGAATGAFATDPQKGDTGSYDAIRNYLWAGMTPKTDPLAAPLRRQLAGMGTVVAAAGVPPEKVQATSGATEGSGPVGFSAALLPYFKSTGQTALLQSQQARVQAQLLEAPPTAQPPYYDYVLGLFGTGWAEQRYQFLPSGRLQLRWEKACPPNATTR